MGAVAEQWAGIRGGESEPTSSTAMLHFEQLILDAQTTVIALQSIPARYRLQHACSCSPHLSSARH